MMHQMHQVDLFPAHLSSESPFNISPNRYELRQFPLVPMGVFASRQFQGLLDFFHLFQKKSIIVVTSKIVVTMFGCHLHNSSGMCLHLARTNMSELPAANEEACL